jgi:hypothetical protein
MFIKKLLLIGLITMVPVTGIYAESISSMSSGSKEQGKDGYFFKSEEYSKSEILVKIVYFESQKSLNKYYNEMNGIQKAKTSTAPKGAFAIIQKNSKECTIYMVKPSSKYYKPELLGHELTHCLMGEFH